MSGRDGATIQNKPRHIQPDQCHSRSWHGLVASYQRNHGIKHVTSAHQFDRIGDYFAAHKGGFHPLCAHRHSIANSYSVELHRRSASRSNAFFHFDRQAAQVEVTRHCLSPCIGHTDNRAFEVFIRKADALEHCSSASALPSICDNAATLFGIECHRYLQSKYYPFLIPSFLSLLCKVSSVMSSSCSHPSPVKLLSSPSKKSMSGAPSVCSSSNDFRRGKPNISRSGLWASTRPSL